MAHIKTVNNQWVVKTIKHDTNDTDTFLMINTTTLCDVAKTLSAGAFKLWIYFMKNKNDYTFALSPTDVRDTFSMGKTQYDNARKELIDKGFLVQMKGNYYTIHDKPYFLSKEERDKVIKQNIILDSDKEWNRELRERKIREQRQAFERIYSD